MEDNSISPVTEPIEAAPAPVSDEPIAENPIPETDEAAADGMPQAGTPAEQDLAPTEFIPEPLHEAAPEEPAETPEPEDTPGTDAIVRIAEEARETAALYPAFDLKTEMEDPRFSAMVFQGVPVRQAYQAMHMDDILTDAMHYAAERARELLVNHLQAGAARPPENGAADRQPASHSFDPRSMTPEQSRDLRERVYRGEKIYL